MKEEKDGFVSFSNQKAGLLSEFTLVQKTVVIVVLICIFLITGILLYRRQRH